jgi:DNA polymerase III sliding clamp (beta) subunit (PCNA family)
MKAVVNTKELLSVLKTVVTIAKAKEPKSVLNCCSLHAYLGGLEIRATDCDVMFETKIDSDTSDGGVRVVNAKALYEFVKAQKKNPTILFESNGFNHLRVLAGNASVSLSCTSPLEFPDIFEPKGFECDGITVKTENLLNAIRHTEKSLSKDTSRPDFCGYLLKESGNDLDVVTCDGHRLSIDRVRIENRKDVLLKDGMKPTYKDLKGNEVVRENYDLFFANAKLMKIVEMCADCDELSIYTYAVKLADGSNGRLFVKNDKFMVWQNVKLTGFDYESVLNIGNRRTAEFILNKKDLIKSLKNIEPAVNKETKTVCVKFNDDNLELFTSGLDNARFDQKEVCKVDRSDGNTGAMIGINHKYFLESVSEMDDEIKITMINPDSPIFVNNLCNLRCTQVVMPTGI